jgi:hypothetical protein
VDSTGTLERTFRDNQAVSSIWGIAIDDFNARDSTIIPSLTSLIGSCNVTIVPVTGKLLEDHGEPRDGMKRFIESIPSQVHVIFGAVKSSVTIPLSVAGGALQIPVISHWSTR